MTGPCGSRMHVLKRWARLIQSASLMVHLNSKAARLPTSGWLDLARWVRKHSLKPANDRCRSSSLTGPLGRHRLELHVCRPDLQNWILQAHARTRHAEAAVSPATERACTRAVLPDRG